MQANKGEKTRRATDEGLNHPDHGIATMPGEDGRTSKDKTQATPGPWHVERQGFQWWVYAPSGEVAALSHGEEDAHLIAAAPDMREAITKYLRPGKTPASTSDAVAALRAALKAANGET